ncbi:MAG: helix-turn-helix domain-containing protein [Terriglobales bacterium]
MPRTSAPPPPSQKRSRESLRRMLDAAEIVVAKYGVEGATLPRIAAQARIAPTNVYRRFRNKEALIRAVFRRLSERSSAETRHQLDPEIVRPIGLVQFSRNIIASMIVGYRANAALSRAAAEYAERHWEVAFIRKARAAELQSFQWMVDTFLIWRDQIKCPDPEYAVRFAFLMVACALRELILFDRMHIFTAALPLDDDSLKHELPRVFLGYLGVKDTGA